ncbi:MAG: M24 family metallopeptidase [Bacteroidota bacterium]
MKNLLILLFFYGFIATASGQLPAILTVEDQARVQDQWLEQRVARILPDLMRREGIDLWLMISREYNEDPVLKTFLPSTWLAARRTTMLLVYDTGDSLRTLACARYNVGNLFQKAWDKEQQPDQWKALSELIAQLDPKRIGINRSEHFGLADGLSSYHYDQLMATLSPDYQKRVVGAERLAISWLETRLPEEMAAYRNIMRLAHEIIAEGLSEHVITPGITRTEEVVWWYRQRIRDLGLRAWFHPTVDVQRADPANTESERSFSGRPADDVIQPGDLVHIDFGITYLGLNTDTQQNAYVLRAGESKPPTYLTDAHEKARQVMDILTDEFKTGRSGNEILANALANSKAKDLEATIYTHPIGYHGHGAGPTIGLWDQQEGVPHRGDYPLYPHTAYSIELNNAIFLPQWNKRIRMMVEEEAFFDGETCTYIGGRQTDLYLIPRVKSGLD